MSASREPTPHDSRACDACILSPRACPHCHDPRQWVNGRPHPSFQAEDKGFAPIGLPGVCLRCDGNPRAPLGSKERDERGRCISCGGFGRCRFCCGTGVPQ